MSQPHSTRRAFVAASGSVATAGILAATSAKAGSPARAALSVSLDQLKSDYDVVVVGSGYGGAVMAARLAAGRSLCVLERGREWSPGTFPSALLTVLAQFRGPINPLGLFDYRAGESLDVLSGSGLGGTSLINANVVIAPDREIFNRWPASIQQDVLQGRMDAWEERVRKVLSTDQVLESDGLRKHAFHRTTTLARSRGGADTSFQPLTLAVNLRRVDQRPNEHGVAQALCTHCGDCVTGCRVGAKNTLDVNYLPMARAAGAQIFSRVEVEWLERLPDSRWRVHVVIRPDGGAAQHRHIIAASVVLAAGALGSTQILLRSRAQGLALSDALGTRFSANGDLLGLGYNTSVQTNVMGFGDGVAPAGERRVGPTITAAASYRNHPTLSQRYLIEEGAIPRALFDALRLGMPPLAGVFPTFPAAQRVARDLLYSRTDGALNHSMVYLGIGHDSAGGKVVLDSNGNARVLWPMIAQEPFVTRMRAEMERHAQTFAGRHVAPPRSGPMFGGALTTVHPLGGCPMADAADRGVVNANGQVFDPRGSSGSVYANLRVVDGSTAPTSIGVNPLLCIAALAERSAERFTS
ncbi:GMC family oxidoreductase N-terminal domain-containing protein [Aquabacterium humicola]|uniref:GMC family oxidoreductase N-terminal domain-containing protein n=1 Tax=Aquabacterium humicola TaxID=3237377 RepID=UPI0025431F56|nr:GMC family oxidoreductase N-terminal domain-containing protein [Rubrivivax pictus]